MRKRDWTTTADTLISRAPTPAKTTIEATAASANAGSTEGQTKGDTAAKSVHDTPATTNHVAFVLPTTSRTPAVPSRTTPMPTKPRVRRYRSVAAGSRKTEASTSLTSPRTR